MSKVFCKATDKKFPVNKLDFSVVGRPLSEKIEECKNVLKRQKRRIMYIFEVNNQTPVVRVIWKDESGWKDEEASRDG